MGNLLGAPVTEKETHAGATDAGSEWGVSSMQGWRVHMEDAHICETKLYACSGATKIALPGHSLFAVFDGHGGTFAAMYSGRNLLRVLSRQPKFAEYAKFATATEPQSSSKSETETEATTAGLALLQAALTSAFVELDKEIYCALKDKKVPDADQPYHDDSNTTDTSSATATAGGGGGSAAAASGASTTTDNDDDNADATNPADAALQLLEEEGDSGTTACVVLLTPNFVVCANAGDSRSVISRLGNKAVPLSYDHKPDDEKEEKRIRAAGGYVAGGRVEGDLAVSRGLGDFRFKNAATVMAAPSNAGGGGGNSSNSSGNNSSGAAQGGAGAENEAPQMAAGDQKVSPIPDIIVQNRNASQDEFIIVACDGIWDVQTNYEAVKTVGEMFQEGEANLGLICEECCDVGLSLGSKDNMTALVVKLAAQKIGQGGGVLARRQLRDAENEESKQEGHA